MQDPVPLGRLPGNESWLDGVVTAETQEGLSAVTCVCPVCTPIQGEQGVGQELVLPVGTATQDPGGKGREALGEAAFHEV